MSIGVRLSLGLPPMVPLNPEMLFIRDMVVVFSFLKGFTNLL
jgi:hypothetical protein